MEPRRSHQASGILPPRKILFPLPRMILDLIQTSDNLKWSRGQITEPEPQPELLVVTSRTPESTLERRNVTAPERLPEARGADEAGVCATGAMIDYLLLPLHRVEIHLDLGRTAGPLTS